MSPPSTICVHNDLPTCNTSISLKSKDYDLVYAIVHQKKKKNSQLISDPHAIPNQLAVREKEFCEES